MHLLRPNDTSRVLTHNYPVAVNIHLMPLLYYETDRIQEKVALFPHLSLPSSALYHPICAPDTSDLLFNPIPSETLQPYTLHRPAPPAAPHKEQSS